MIIRPWWLKCIGQRILSHVPAGYRLNALWGAKARVGALNTDLLCQGVRYVRTLRELGFGLEGAGSCRGGTIGTISIRG
jgi:hypothetical protein